MSKIIFVDIDNTLWDFASVLYQKLIDNGYSVPKPSYWDWLFYQKYLPKETFYNLAHQVHLEQENYKPFPDARDFLKWLKVNGFTVIIASNRRFDTKPTTERWLLSNHLDFDDLLIVPDKTAFINDKVEIVVDDSPVVLQHTLQKKVFATGLAYAWNESLKSEIPLWYSLSQCRDYLQLFL